MKTARWYTYKLCYPNGTSFYFGKGTHNRAYQHRGQAKKNLVLRDRVINDILHRGLDFTVKIIEHYDNENEAFRIERENIKGFSVTELLTNVVHNAVPHNWKKHQQQLNVPLRVFQTTTQAWPDEEYRLGATTQRWEDDETIIIRKRHETQIKQDILNEVTANKKSIERAKEKGRMIAEYEKMISERNHHERKFPPTNKDENEEQDETYRETYSDETYAEETECGYCGTVFSDARDLEDHYENCSEKYKATRRTIKF